MNSQFSIESQVYNWQKMESQIALKSLVNASKILMLLEKSILRETHISIYLRKTVSKNCVNLDHLRIL